MLAERRNAKLMLDTHASHYVHTGQPQRVIDSIRYVVDRVRSGAGPRGIDMPKRANEFMG